MLTQAEQGITSSTGVSWYYWLSSDQGQVSTHISWSTPSFVPACLLSSIYSFTVNKDIQRLWRAQAEAHEAENASEEAISLVSTDVFANEDACRREERERKGAQAPGSSCSGRDHMGKSQVESVSKEQQMCRSQLPPSNCNSFAVI